MPRVALALCTTALLAAACGPSGSGSIPSETARPAPLAPLSPSTSRLVAQGTEVREQYTYDGAGNLTEVSDAGAPAPVTIASFSPAQGTIGQRVTIAGTGFSTVGAGNLVQVAGVPASILSASANQLTIAIPAGASTGRIAITTGDGTALSATDLVVLKPVVVSDFTPKIGGAGTVLTIFGDGFDPTAANDDVSVGSGLATITVASASSITATLGAGTTTGKVSVSTGYASGTSAQDFFMPPDGVAAADVAFMGRATLGAASTVALSSAGRAGLLAFDGRSGQHLTLYATNDTFAGTTTLALHDPAGNLVYAWKALSGQSYKFVVPDLVRTGTYTLAVRPSATSTGAISLTIFEDVEIRLDPRGPAVAMNLLPGQNGRCVFTARSGDAIGLAYPSFATSPPGGAIGLSLFGPDATLIANSPQAFGITSAGSWQLPELSQSGMHVLTVRPVGMPGGSFTFLVSNPVSAKLVADGPKVRFQSSRPAQAGRFSFDAVAGQSLTLRVTTGATFPSKVSVLVTGADGTFVSRGDVASSGDVKLDLDDLPGTQTYVVSITPNGLDTGWVDLQLLTQDAGVIAVDGAARTVSLTAARNGRYEFQANAGDFIGVAASGLTTTPVTTVSIRVLSPSGTRVIQPTFNGSDSAQTDALPESGTYTLVVEPTGTASASMSLLLSRPLSVRLSAEAPALRFQTARPGQSGRYTFDLAPAQMLTLRATTSSTFSSGVSVTVQDPAGRSLVTTTVPSGGDAKLDLTSATTAGPHTVVVVPKKTETGWVDLRLINVATDTFIIGDAAKTESVGAAQNGHFAFAGTAGEYLSIGFPSLTTSPTNAGAVVYVYEPDGSPLASTPATGPGSLQLPQLSVTGTYTVRFKPSGTASGSVSFLVSRPVLGTVSTSGSETTFTTARAGQAGRYSFTAEAGETYALALLIDSTFQNGIRANVLLPDGTSLVGNTFAGGSSSKLNVDRLPVTGTYTVLLTPLAAGTGTIKFRLTPPSLDTLIVGAPERTFTLQPGQNGTITFSGAAGDRLALGFTSVTTDPAGGNVILNVLTPDRTVLSPVSASNGGSAQLAQLPMTGTYTISVVPPGYASTRLTLLLSSPLTGTLPADGTLLEHQGSRAGQEGRYGFGASIGQSYTLRVAVPTTYATGASVSVLTPTSSTLVSGSVVGPGSDRKIDLSLLAFSGTYLLDIQPKGLGTGTIGLHLIPQATDTLTVGAAPKTLTLTAAQNGRYTFSASAGDLLNLVFSSVTITPASGAIGLSVLKPDGTSMLNPTLSGPRTIQLAQVPATGIYTLTLAPPGVSAATCVMQITRR